MSDDGDDGGPDGGAEDGDGGAVRLRFAAAGDVHGRFDLLAGYLAEARRRCGPIAFVLGVGDGEPNRDEADLAGSTVPPQHRTVGTFPAVAAGTIDLGAPFLFIGGNHDPYPALDAVGPGRWAPGAEFLGRSGVRTVDGLRIGFLSGIHAPTVSELTPDERRAVLGKKPKALTYWVRSEIDHLRAEVAAGPPLDVLVTHDWPNRLGRNDRNLPVGNADVRALVEDLQPRLHLCGHIHSSLDAVVGRTRVVGLTLADAGPESVAVFDVGTDGSIVSSPGDLRA